MPKRTPTHADESDEESSSSSISKLSLPKKKAKQRQSKQGTSLAHSSNALSSKVGSSKPSRSKTTSASATKDSTSTVTATLCNRKSARVLERQTRPSQVTPKSPTDDNSTADSYSSMTAMQMHDYCRQNYTPGDPAILKPPVFVYLSLFQGKGVAHFQKQFYQTGGRGHDPIPLRSDFYTKIDEVEEELAGLVPPNFQLKHLDNSESRKIFTLTDRPTDVTFTKTPRGQELFTIDRTHLWQLAIAEKGYHVWGDDGLDAVILHLCLAVSPHTKSTRTTNITSKSITEERPKKMSALEKRQQSIRSGNFVLQLSVKGPVRGRSLDTQEIVGTVSIPIQERPMFPCIGFVSAQVKDFASAHSQYKDLIGKDSCIVIHTGGRKPTTSDPIRRTETLEQYVLEAAGKQQKYSFVNGTLVIKLSVGVGVRKVDAEAYEANAFDDLAEATTEQVECSQDSDTFASPEKELKSSSKRGSRAAMDDKNEKVASFLKRVVQTEDSPCYWAFHAAQYNFLLHHLKVFRFEERWCHEKWSLDDHGDDEEWTTWPTLLDLTKLLPPTTRGAGREPGLGKYRFSDLDALPASVNQGSTESSKEMQVFESFLNRMAPTQTTNQCVVATFQVVKLDEHCCVAESIFVVMPLSTTMSLLDLYNHPLLKPLQFWSDEEVEALEAKSKEVHLSFPRDIDNKDTKVFLDVSQDNLGNINLFNTHQSSIPDDKKNPVVVCMYLKDVPKQKTGRRHWNGF